MRSWWRALTTPLVVVVVVAVAVAGVDAGAVPSAVGPSAVGPSAVGPPAVGPPAVGPSAVGPSAVGLSADEPTDELERAILDELNLLRADPRAYGRHLKLLRPRFDGPLLWRGPGERPVRTVEGARALEECIAALAAAAAARPRLVENAALARAAREHVVDQGPTGAVGHRGTDGSSSFDRISRQGRSLGRSGEVIDYGWTTAREIVTDLLIDDGVADRGHRRALLEGRYAEAGVACGRHARFGVMCVVELAQSFQANE